ncbi:hypothetical protein LCGC14_0416620 [marine sediment metagenome]|uniref:Fibronectin type-III domain-containing protein n=1 Tax=marine sediment metagenome TaxID=412755 RepID=A0A0F9W190_9ZZZZ
MAILIAPVATSSRELRRFDPTWAEAWTAASASLLRSTSLILCGTQTSNSSQYIIYRLALPFNTSSLPADAVISSAILRLSVNTFVNQSQDEGGEIEPFTFSISNGQPTYPRIPVVLGDYDKELYSGNGGEVLAASGLLYMTLNSTGRSWINIGGTTKFFLRSSRDIENTPSYREGSSGVIADLCSIMKTLSLTRLIITYIALIVTSQECTDTIAEQSTGHGTITDLGSSNVTQHGHVWSTSSGPTTADSKTENGAKPNLGQFRSNITGLIPSTTYYVKAYATNTEGTAYGGEVEITTLGTIGRRHWWIEKDCLHYFDQFGVERKIEGTTVTGYVPVWMLFR